MGEVLIINNIKVDLSPSTSIALSSQSNDIGEIKDRQGNFSNTFKLPDTSLNRSVFGFANIPSSQAVEPYRKLPCKYYADGVEIVGNGYCVCVGSNNGFSIVIYSGNTSLFDALEGKNLSDLDTSLFDMVSTPWNFAGVVAMYGAGGSPCYFLVDDGTVSQSDREIEASTMYPMMRFSDIFNMIMTEAGFSFSGDIFSNLDYTRKLFPYCGDEEPKQGIEEIEGAKVSAYFNGNFRFLFGVFNTKLICDDDSVEGSDPFNRYNTLTGEYILPYMAEVKVKAHIVFDIVFLLGVSTEILYVYIKVNGVQVGITTYTGVISTLGRVELDNEIVFDSNVGDVVTVHVGHTYNTSVVDIVSTNIATGGKTNVDFSITDKNYFGGRWRHSANFPSMSQKDFLKGFMQEYSLQCDTDNFSKVVKFYTMDEVEANKSIAPDWSSYVDTRNYSIEYHSQKYGQLNNLLYKEDESVTDGTGNGSFTIDDQTLKPTVDAFTLPWAASENVIRMQGVPMAQIRRINEDGDSVKPVQRVIKATGAPIPIGGNPITIKDTPSAQSFDSSFMFATTFDYDMNRLIDEYGSLLIVMLQRYGAITVILNLPSWEYNRLRHDVPVYVKQLGGMMYLNKVSDFKSGKLCKCELIRM